MRTVSSYSPPLPFIWGKTAAAGTGNEKRRGNWEAKNCFYSNFQAVFATTAFTFESAFVAAALDEDDCCVWVSSSNFSSAVNPWIWVLCRPISGPEILGQRKLGVPSYSWIYRVNNWSTFALPNSFEIRLLESCAHHVEIPLHHYYHSNYYANNSKATLAGRLGHFTFQCYRFFFRFLWFSLQLLII